ncbi:MAG: hypothetical protein JW832_04925 [Deltaproteobacteria bacterium]|nr:hypothetical protein [Deltaproteobacteria bacterium]
MKKKTLAVVMVFLLSFFSSGCGLTEKQKEAIIETHEAISESADAILLQKNPFEKFEEMLPEYKSYSNVEDAWVTDDALHVKYKRGGIAVWQITPDYILPPYTRVSPNCDRLPGSFQIRTNINTAASGAGNTVCLVDILSDDERFAFCKDIIADLSTSFERNNFIVTVKTKADADIDFFAHELKNFKVVILFSHGGVTYLGDDLNMLCTGTEFSSFEAFLESYPAQWISRELVFLAHTIRKNGEDDSILRAAITRNFINNKYANADFDKAWFYLAGCKGLSTTQFSDAFTSKGAAVTIGWDDVNCIGPVTAQLLFESLLGGANLRSAIDALPQEARVSKCEVPEGANLVFYPASAGAAGLSNPAIYEITITSPDDGATYGSRFVQLTGEMPDVMRIEHGTVELNGIATTLTTTSDTTFSQPLVLRSGANTIKVNCYAVKDAEGNAAFASREMTVNGDFPVLDLFTELRWNTDYSDVDLHLLPPESGIADLWTYRDCFYYNKTTDWGAVLDVDDTEGFGPEHITMQSAGLSGVYRLFVHYYDEDGAGSSDATIDVSVKDGPLHTFGPFHLTADGWYAGSLWEVCTIEFPGGVITPVEQSYDLNAYGQAFGADSAFSSLPIK